MSASRSAADKRTDFFRPAVVAMLRWFCVAVMGSLLWTLAAKRDPVWESRRWCLGGGALSVFAASHRSVWAVAVFFAFSTHMFPVRLWLSSFVSSPVSSAKCLGLFMCLGGVCWCVPDELVRCAAPGDGSGDGPGDPVYGSAGYFPWLSSLVKSVAFWENGVCATASVSSLSRNELVRVVWWWVFGGVGGFFLVDDCDRFHSLHFPDALWFCVMALRISLWGMWGLCFSCSRVLSSSMNWDAMILLISSGTVFAARVRSSSSMTSAGTWSHSCVLSLRKHLIGFRERTRDWDCNGGWGGGGLCGS